MSKRYNPMHDPAVKRILRATTEEQRKKIERDVVTQSDNRPKKTDPVQRTTKRRR